VALYRHLGNCDLATLFIYAGCDEMRKLSRARLSALGELPAGIERNVWKYAIEQLLLFSFSQRRKICESDSLLTEADAELPRKWDMTDDRIVTLRQAIAFHKVRPNLYGIEKVDIDRVSLAWMERFE
jgi:hypothetical protein